MVQTNFNVMQMKRLFLLLFAIIPCAFINAQLTDLSYVVDRSGETIQGNVIYHAPILKDPFFKVDEVTLDWNAVGTIKNRHGLFINVSEFNRGKQSYAMRVLPGTISVFEQVDMRVYGGESLPAQLSAREEEKMLAQGRMDYLMDEMGNVYGTSYRELRDVYAYSAGAMYHVKRARRYQILRGLLAGVGGILTGVGVAQAAYGGGLSPALVMGVVGAGSNFLFVPAIEDAKWQALETYNRE